jgi:hypothetical protein
MLVADCQVSNNTTSFTERVEIGLCMCRERGRQRENGRKKERRQRERG